MYVFHFSLFMQVDGSSSRPQSMEGPMDSGISLNGDTISSPDSDNSSQHHIQNQTVCINDIKIFLLLKQTFFFFRNTCFFTFHCIVIPLLIWCVPLARTHTGY